MYIAFKTNSTKAFESSLYPSSAFLKHEKSDYINVPCRSISEDVYALYRFMTSFLKYDI